MNHYEMLSFPFMKKKRGIEYQTYERGWGQPRSLKAKYEKVGRDGAGRVSSEIFQ